MPPTGRNSRNLFFHGSEAGSAKARCQQGRAPSEGSREASSIAFAALGGHELSLAQDSVAPTSASISTCSSPWRICLFLFPSLVRIPVVGFRAYLGNPG